jgi:hypothetical protein
MLKRRLVVAAGGLVTLLAATLPAALRVENVQSTGGLPPHLAGLYREAAAFQQARSGQYFVFDRRAHAVFGVDRDMTTTWKLVEIGQEPGRLLDPSAFALEPGGNFVVADAPSGVERIQIFAPGGSQIGGFTLPGRSQARVTMGDIVISGASSLQFLGKSILMSQPETGGLVTEYALDGTPLRSIGVLRRTGHESESDLHLALNSGFPLVNPLGGFYFVFQAGVPLYRKYDQSGGLIFERHIEGLEVDAHVASIPTVWPRRKLGAGRELPLVASGIRTAAVDPGGNLWIVLASGVTYVYDRDGEKTRAVRFAAAGALNPSSVFFAGPNRLLATPGCYEFRVSPNRPGG